MTIIRTRLSTDGYTVVPNHWLRDRRLSWKAKGLLAYLASHAEGYELRTEQIVRESRDGRDAVLNGLKELETLGYLVRHHPRNERGHITETIFEIFENPQDGKPVREEPPPSPPKPDNPDTGKPDDGKGGQLRTPQEENTKRSSGASQSSTASRGTRLTEDFEVTEEMKAWAREKAPGIGWTEHEKFMNYYLSITGPKAQRRDWVRTWRNWMLNAVERKQPSRFVRERPAPESPAVYRHDRQTGQQCARHGGPRESCDRCLSELAEDEQVRGKVSA